MRGPLSGPLLLRRMRTTLTPSRSSPALVRFGISNIRTIRTERSRKSHEHTSRLRFVSETHQPYKGRVAMFTLIAAESAFFTIFVVAYIYYIGQSLSGPTPREVLDPPDFQHDFPALFEPHDLAGRTRPGSPRYGYLRCVLGTHDSLGRDLSSLAPLASGTSSSPSTTSRSAQTSLARRTTLSSACMRFTSSSG